MTAPAKPVVFYRGQAQKYLARAVLRPINHPDSERVSNRKLALTSLVLRWNETTGEIETENTIYLPEVK